MKDLATSAAARHDDCAEMLRSEMLPGVASVYFLGHLFFAMQATRLASKTGRPVTAFPQGVNIVPLIGGGFHDAPRDSD